MAYTLNTGHALYSNLVELFGVQSGALVAHKVARTFTKHAEASFGTGTYGEHFTTVDGGYTAKGASFSPAVDWNTTTTALSVVVVLNRRAGVSAGGGGVLGRSSGITIVSPGWSNAGVGGVYDAGNIAFAGSAITTGAQMLTMVRDAGDGATNGHIYSNGALQANGQPGYSSASRIYDYLGGNPGACALNCDIVWVAFFNKALSISEISDLYGSLGASNSFGLVSSPAPTTDFTITTADATFSGGGVVRPMASFAITAADATFSGGAGQLTSASLASTTANATFAGGATGDVTQGTITCPALKNNTGTVLANETGVTAYVYSVATGAHVVTKTGQTTNPSGILTFTDATIAAGTTYRVVIVLGSGDEGMDKVAAT